MGRRDLGPALARHPALDRAPRLERRDVPVQLRDLGRLRGERSPILVPRLHRSGGLPARRSGVRPHDLPLQGRERPEGPLRGGLVDPRRSARRDDRSGHRPARRARRVLAGDRAAQGRRAGGLQPAGQGLGQGLVGQPLPGDHGARLPPPGVPGLGLGARARGGRQPRRGGARRPVPVRRGAEEGRGPVALVERVAAVPARRVERLVVRPRVQLVGGRGLRRAGAARRRGEDAGRRALDLPLDGARRGTRSAGRAVPRG